jgi:hypothetical protein
LKILLFSPAAVGGIAEHAHYQVRAAEKDRLSILK